MALPRPASPRVLWQDMISFFGQKGRHKFLFAFLAILFPTLAVWGLYLDSRTQPPKPTMTFIASWPATRSDAEIIAQQKIDQKKREAQNRAKQQAYQRLEKRLGIE